MPEILTDAYLLFTFVFKQALSTEVGTEVPTYLRWKGRTTERSMGQNVVRPMRCQIEIFHSLRQISMSSAYIVKCSTRMALI